MNLPPYGSRYSLSGSKGFEHMGELDSCVARAGYLETRTIQLSML